MACSTVPKRKPIQFISDQNCWYQEEAQYDWKCEVDLDKKLLASLLKQGDLMTSYDEVYQTTCWQYKIKEGDWEARCQEDKLETYKRAGCGLVRMGSGLVGVTCP